MAAPAKSSPAKYYLAVRAGAPVGPHRLDSLREWVERGVIGANWQACKEGDESWVALSDIPRFSEHPKRVRERLEWFRTRTLEPWWSEAPTEKQLAKLRYFEIPFTEAGLTKGRASELIEAFIALDPERETQYQDRPSTAAQRKQIRSLKGDPNDLTYSEARNLIEELTQEKEEKEFDAAINFEILDDMLNDEDVREICGYKKLTKSQVKQMLEHLTAHFPGWEKESRFDLGELVHQVLSARPAAASRAASPQTIASLGHLPLARPIPPKSALSLPAAIAVVLGVIVVGAYLTYFRQPTTDTNRTVKSDLAAPIATPAAKPTAAAVENFQAAVAASKKRALAAYPQLGVAGSPFNRVFVAEYEQMVKKGDPRLSKPDWPEELAARCAK